MEIYHLRQAWIRNLGGKSQHLDKTAGMWLFPEGCNMGNLSPCAHQRCWVWAKTVQNCKHRKRALECRCCLSFMHRNYSRIFYFLKDSETSLGFWWSLPGKDSPPMWEYEKPQQNPTICLLSIEREKYPPPLDARDKFLSSLSLSGREFCHIGQWFNFTL
jgi:hypothetical protein